VALGLWRGSEARLSIEPVEETLVCCLAPRPPPLRPATLPRRPLILPMYVSLVLVAPDRLIRLPLRLHIRIGDIFLNIFRCSSACLKLLLFRPAVPVRAVFGCAIPARTALFLTPLAAMSLNDASLLNCTAFASIWEGLQAEMLDQLAQSGLWGPPRSSRVKVVESSADLAVPRTAHFCGLPGIEFTL